MSNYSYTLYKISMRIYKKCYSELTSNEKSEVMNIYYDFY